MKKNPWRIFRLPQRKPKDIIDYEAFKNEIKPKGLATHIIARHRPKYRGEI